MNYLFAISGAFSALFSLLLFTKKRKGPEDWVLAVMFLLVTINCLFVFNFAKSSELYYVPIFSELNYAIPLLYGPLLYFYIRALTTRDFVFKRKDWLHSIPFLLFLVIITLPVWTNLKIEPKGAQLGYPFLKLFLTPFYLLAAIRVLRNYHSRYLDEYSFEMETNIVWMNWIVIGGVIMWVIATVSYAYNWWAPENRILLYDYYTLSFLSVFLFALAFVAVKNSSLFSDKGSEKSSIIKLLDKAMPDPEPRSAAVDEPVAADSGQEEKDLERLVAAMEADELFSDPLLTLAKLSKLTSIPAYRISKVLKTSENGSFYDFVNRHRVERVKALLAAGKAEQLSLLGIAEEAGFNSKASFNRVFKKLTGLTPSQYLKKT